MYFFCLCWPRPAPDKGPCPQVRAPLECTATVSRANVAHWTGRCRHRPLALALTDKKSAITCHYDPSLSCRAASQDPSPRAKRAAGSDDKRGQRECRRGRHCCPDRTRRHRGQWKTIEALRPCSILGLGMHLRAVG